MQSAGQPASKKEFAQALAMSTVIFLILSLYLSWRRGYYDLYIENKVFAGVSFILLMMVLVLGTLSRLYNRFDHLLIFRKQYGLLAFYYALIHSIISLFFLPRHFPSSYFKAHGLTFTLGAYGLSILFLLFLFSFNRISRFVDKKTWWLLQNWGVRIGVFFILLHVGIMKIAGWIRWYREGGAAELFRPYMPPTGLLVASTALPVILIRVSELCRKKTTAQTIIKIGLIVYIVFILATFGLGFARIDKSPPLDWVTCTKIPHSLITETNPRVCYTPGGRVVIGSR